MKKIKLYYSFLLLLFFCHGHAQLIISTNQAGVNDTDPNKIIVQQPTVGSITISPSGTTNSTLQIAPTQGSTIYNSTGVNQGGSSATVPTLNYNTVVGTLEGSPSVGTNGAANYSIPIPLPPGTHDMAPKLNLQYNSNIGEGIMGMGWSLGLSSIVRVNQDIYHDGACKSIALDATDGLSLDGNRMYVTSGSNFTTNCVYRLEDETYTRITYATNTSGANYFLAETKQGIKMEYGSTPDSKITFTSGTNSLYYEYYLNKVYDNFGNYISYIYNNDPTTHEVTLKEIDYTYNDAASISSYNSIQFFYDTKDASNYDTKIVSGNTITKTKLLNEIDVKCGPSYIKKYNFDYAESSYHNYLNQIDITDYDGNKLNPMVFEYGGHTTTSTCNNSNGFYYCTTSVIPYGVGSATGDDADSYTGDFNGDGRTDIVSFPYNQISCTTANSFQFKKTYESNFKVFYSSGLGDFSSIASSSVAFPTNFTFYYPDNTTEFFPRNYASTNNPHQYGPSLRDFNGDGKTDIAILTIGSSNKTTVVLIEPGTSGFTQTTTACVLNAWERIIFADIDGDQIPEGIIYQGATLNNPTQNANLKVFDFKNNVFLNNGTAISVSGTIASGSAWSSINTVYSGISAMDVNGDGTDEVYVVWEGFGYYLRISKSGSSFTATSFWQSPNAIPVGQTGSQDFYGDFNGDGIADLARANLGTISSMPAPPGTGGKNVNLFYGLGNNQGFSTSSSFGYDDSNFYGDIQRTYLSADINGDNKTDLVEIYSQNCFDNTANPGNAQIDIYYWDSDKPHSKIHLGTIGTYPAILNYILSSANQDYDFDGAAGFTGTKDISKMPVFLTGDFNGDGRQDLLFKIGDSFVANANCSGITVPQVFIVASFNPENDEHLLTQVYDGFDRSTSFLYGSTSVSTSSPFYTSGTVTPPIGVKKYNGPEWVTTKLQVSDGIGGNNETDYTYQGGMMHLQGKGFLDFDQMVSKNLVNGITSTDLYTLSSTYFERYPKSTTNILTTGSTPVNSTNYTYSTLVPTSGSGKGHFAYLQAKTATDNLSKFITQSNYTYTADGNLSTAITSYATTTPSSIVETNTVSTVYFTNNSTGTDTWLPTWPLDVTTSTTRGTNANYQRKLNYTYTQQGEVLTAIQDQGQAGYIETDYVYDPTGVLTQKTTTAPTGGSTGNALPVKVYSYGYDSYKRFVRQTTNPLNQVSYSDFDERFGSLTYTKDITNLETYYTYDGEGRLIKKVTPDNITTNISYSFVQPGTVVSTGEPISNYASYILYSVNAVTTGKPSVLKYFDMFDREVADQTDAFDPAKPICTAKIYDALGHVSQQTSPYFKGTGNALTGLVTTNLFDAFQRPLNCTTSYSGLSSPNITKYAYAIEAATGNYQTTTTMPDQTTKSTYVDPSGLLIKTVDALGDIVNFDYWSNRKTKTVSIGTGNIPTQQITYDSYARPNQLTEPNSGITTYAYNAYGLLESTTDARNITIKTFYDVLDRPTGKSCPDGFFTYQYVQGGNGLNLIQNEMSPLGISYIYSYDNLNRLIQKNVQMGSNYITGFTYDQYNNIIKITYPGGFYITQDYTSKGYLTDIKRDNGNLVWQANEMIPFGQYNKYTLGNGQQTVVSYNNFDMPTQYNAGTVFNYKLTPDITNGNITNRNDLTRNLTESFGYDNLNRLTTSTINGIVTTVAYDPNGNGNISSKTSGSVNGSDLGNYTYQSSQFNQLNTVDNVDASISLNVQSATYNSFSKVNNITEGIYTYNLGYGPDMQRANTTLINTTNNAQYNRYYTANYEKTIGPSNFTREINYIHAPGGLCAMDVKNGTNDTLYFVYTDHLGSILKLTDAGAVSRGEQSFDAWGRYRNINDWTYTTPQIIDGISYRGFTGHEHLPNFEIINMNGRIYDSKLGLFLSIDPLLAKTPGISPYHYANNNPLKFTDPTGTTGQSTHTDALGKVLAVYDDGDLGVYKHKDAKTKEDIDKMYNKTNPSAGGEKMGITFESLSFANFNDLKQGIKGTGIGKIDFNSNEGMMFLKNNIINNTPSLANYALNWKSYNFKMVGYNQSKGDPEEYVYRGSKIFGKIYASARDIGNIGAGYVAGYNGLDWEDTKFVFERFQASSNGTNPIGAFYKNGTEGMQTVIAEKAGWSSGYEHYNKQQSKILDNKMKTGYVPITNWER